jgi:DNA-binding NarL/FixJ family response regulator
MSVSILVAENDALLQSLLVEILGREEGFEIVGSVGTIPEALEAVAQLRPQVLLLDLDLMGPAGVKVLATLGELPEAPSVLALSGDENEDTQLEAIKNGVCGFLPKSQGAAALPEAIRALAHGQLWFSPQLSVRIFREYHQLVRRFREHERPANQLSARECEVLQRVARGMTNNQIARDLFMSIHTVKLHVQNILRKLNLPNRTEAAVFAVKEGLLDTCS